MAEKKASVISQVALDQTCLEALNNLIEKTRANLKEISGKVFADMSQHAENQDGDALAHLMALYDHGHSVAQPAKDFNDDVGEMVELLQAKIASGVEPSLDDLKAINHEDAVSLAEHQKKLESLVVMDERLKQKMLPAMASMQVEDAINQRLGHLVEVWTSFVDHVQSGDSDASLVAESMGKACHAAEQANDYFGIVLERTAPESIEKRSVFIEF